MPAYLVWPAKWAPASRPAQARCIAELAFERAIEVRQVSEAAGIGDVADAQMSPRGIAQHRQGFGQPAPLNGQAHRFAVLFHQPFDHSPCEAVPPGDPMAV